MICSSLPAPQPTAVSLCSLSRMVCRAVLVAFLLGGPWSASARPPRWQPVDPQDLAATDSATAPGVDTEILLSTHEVSETIVGETETEDFVRAKVYTRKGVEDQKFSILYADDTVVNQPEARVVKPDGSSIELRKEDIFETVEAKAGGERVKRLSLVFPNLAPGDVVEYRWKTCTDGYYYVRSIFCQEDVPVREYHFIVGRMHNRGRISSQNIPAANLDKSSHAKEIIARNLPAFEEEEFMPAQREFRGWVFMLKTFQEYDDKKLWLFRSADGAKRFEEATQDWRVKGKARELIAGASSDEEKLRRLYEFCQREITNYSWVNSPEIQVAREKSAKGRTLESPKGVLSKRAGWEPEINQLFAALAWAAGYQVREARNASRTELLNVRGYDGWSFMKRRSVAVEVGGQWRYFRPGSYFLPYGVLDWRDEGATVFRCDEAKEVLFEQLPAQPAERNQVQRKGRFSLDAEGTLEGEVEIELTGHPAIARKIETWKDSLEDVNKEHREGTTKRLPNAEVSAIAWTNLRTQEMPLKVTYHLRVPGYAEAVGKRLVFAPSVFEVGAPVVFAAATRKFPIVFPFAYSEHDDIEIALPEGFVLDKPTAPPVVRGGGEAIKATHQIQYSVKTRTLGLKRDFILGGSGVISFRAESYPVLKDVYESLHKADAHSLMLKPKEAPAVP